MDRHRNRLFVPSAAPTARRRRVDPFASAAILCCVAGLVASSGCKPKPPIPIIKRPDGSVVEAPPAPEQEEEQAAEALAKEADSLAADGRETEAEAMRDKLVETYPGTGAGGDELLRRAQVADEAGQADEAIAWYEKLLFYCPSFPEADAVRTRYAELLLGAGRYEDAANMLRALFRSAAPSPDKVRLAALLADAFEGVQLYAAALPMHVYVQNGTTSAEARDRANRRALEIIDGRLDFREAESLWEESRGDPAWCRAEPALGFKLAKIYYHVRDFERSADMLRLVASEYGASPYAPQARDLLERLKARFEVDPFGVGVILPLSGRRRQWGNRSLQAIRMAFGDSSPFTLIIKDSEGDPAVAAKAVEDLVLQQHVIAIVGPLFSKGAMAAALKAEELSVPILLLSHREGLPQLGPYVFSTGLTVQAQARALAKTAFERLGFSRFALLYPNRGYGEQFAGAFWDEVERRRGEIRGAESYEHDATTFREPVRKLVGRYYWYSRQEYRDKLKELKKLKLPPHRFKYEVEKMQKRLPPVVDFDAIVIPDQGRRVGLIAPALVFEDLVMTRDEKRLEKIRKATGFEDIRPVTLLGASTWNTPMTVEHCEQYCEGALFVDAYYPDSPTSRVRDFVSAFKEKSGVDPSFTEAQAYDTAKLLQQVLSSSKLVKRRDLRAALVTLRRFKGVTGEMRFDKHGEADRQLFVLTVADRTIQEWVPPTEEPEG